MRWYDACQITHNSQVPQFDNLFICKSKTSTSSTWTSIGSSSVLWAPSLLSLSIWGQCQCQGTVFIGKVVYSRLSCQTMHDYIIITVTWPDLYCTSRWAVRHYIPASAISADFIWRHLISSYMILYDLICHCCVLQANLWHYNQKKSFQHIPSEALLCVGRMEGRRNVVSSIVHSSSQNILRAFNFSQGDFSWFTDATGSAGDGRSVGHWVDVRPLI